MTKPQRHVFICQNDRGPESTRSCCARRGSGEILEEFRKRVKAYFKNKEVKVSRSGCLGPCEQGVNMVIYPDAIWHHGVTLADVDEIFQSDIVGRHPE